MENEKIVFSNDFLEQNKVLLRKLPAKASQGRDFKNDTNCTQN